MTTIPIDRDGAIRAHKLSAAGIHLNVLYRAVADGEFDRIGPGLYVPADTSVDARHRLLVRDLSTGTRAVVSHQSAALLHDLPMLAPDLSRVHLTVAPGTPLPDSEFRSIHARHLPPADVVKVRHRWATSLERTAVEVAASSPMGFAGALAVFDAALRHGARPELLATHVRRHADTPMIRAALRNSSPLADGVGESWCRAQLLAAGLPRPRLKHAIVDLRGEVIAEPDLDWGGRLVVEFDGSTRYGRVRLAGDTSVSAVWRAIERDEVLARRRGITVLRFTWANLVRRDVAPACHQWLRRLDLLAAA